MLKNQEKKQIRNQNILPTVIINKNAELNEIAGVLDENFTAFARENEKEKTLNVTTYTFCFTAYCIKDRFLLQK